MIPDSFIEELKYASGIEQVVSSYITLKRRGRNLTGLCPFHSEKTPSFTVYPESGSYYCFGCGAGGDVITFVRQVENLEYVEAIKFLAQRAGLTVPEDAHDDGAARQKARVYEINRETARFYHETLMSEAGAGALAYLLGRGLKKKTIRGFGLGYAPPGWDSLRDYLKGKGFSYEDMAAAAVVTRGKNGSFYDSFRERVIFPIIDLRGGVIGFGGRIMNGNGPKYLNSPDTPVFKKSRNLFALNFAKAAQSDTLVLGEGYMDVIAMHQAGFTNAVATLGTSLTAEQCNLMSRYAKKLVIAYDSDGAGQNAARRAINLLGKNSMSVSVLEMEGAKDPDEYIKKFGGVRFANRIDSSKNALQYEVDRLKTRYDLDDPEGRTGFLNAFCEMMANINSDMQRDVYIGKIAEELGADKQKIVMLTDSILKGKALAAKRRDEHNLANFTQDKAGETAQARRKLDNPNLGGYKAEETFLAIILEHPDYLINLKNDIEEGDFYDHDHRQIFSVLAARIAQGQNVEPIHLSSGLNPAQMARLSHILAKSREIKFYPRQAEEYIRAIRAQGEVKNTREVGEMSPEEYSRYIASLTLNKK